MALRRKKHAHPPLTPPRHDKRYLIVSHSPVRVRGEYHENDDGKVVDGRVYTFHPTKGWRNRSAKIVLGIA